MGKALYRLYRSTSFDEVVGQEHVTTTLKNSLKSGSIAHAYLLTGPRGVGKTSVARILAFEVNGLPYDKDGTHLDIIEIDAASNRRIDEIRSLRERVNIAPTSAKYKVYIIDEVHMLTREAFNALLKTLEEPPEHVIFILATTEAHKLPDTIISRCISFTFRPIDEAAMVAQLKMISKAEKIQVADDALALLAQYGEGSLRDSISQLDQIKNISGGKINRSDVELALGLAPQQTIKAILDAVASGSPQKLEEALEQAYKNGASDSNLAKQLAELIRRQLLENQLDLPVDQAIGLLKELLDVPGSSKPRASLELGLLDCLFRNSQAENTTDNPVQEVAVDIVPAKEVSSKTVEKRSQPEKSSNQMGDKPGSVEQSNEQPESQSEISLSLKGPEPGNNETAATIEVNQELWDKILQKLKTQNNTLYGIARMAQTDLHKDTLHMRFRFPFHFKQVNQPKNKSILSTILEELGHKNLMLNITLQADPKALGASSNTASSAKQIPKQDKTLVNINNIFGDAEVLES